MKNGLHPEYRVSDIVCSSCGTVWAIGSTRPNMRVSICSNCHPFYTGEQRRIVDTEGQVDRFMKRLATAQQRQADAQRRRESKSKSRQQKPSLLSEIYGEEAAAEQDTISEPAASSE